MSLHRVWWMGLRNVLVGAALAGWLSGCMVYHWHDLPPAAAQELEAGKLRIELTLHDGTVVEGKLRSIDRENLKLIVDTTHPIEVDLTKVVSARIGYFDLPASVLASVGAGLGAVAGAAVIITVIVLLTKSSCPFVYVVDAEGHRTLIGEGYSGAVARALQRPDQIPLPTPTSDTLDVVLADEAHETQLTDAAWLVVVDHGPGERALATASGTTVLAGPEVPPDAVVDLEGADVSALVAGGTSWATDMNRVAEMSDPPREEGLVASVSAAPEHAALELVLANSPWIDVVAGHAWAALGDRLPEAQERGRDPALHDRLLGRMRDGGIHLAVEVRDGDGWRTVGWVAPVGWAAARRLVVPLDGVVAGEPLEARIRGGVGFHRVAWMGFTSVIDATPDTVVVPPAVARGPEGTDERATLATADGSWQSLPDRGAELSMSFPLPPVAEDQERAVFLHLDGYYEVHQRPDAKLEPLTVAALAGRPERMSAFSVGLYKRLLQTLPDGGVQ